MIEKRSLFYTTEKLGPLKKEMDLIVFFFSFANLLMYWSLLFCLKYIEAEHDNKGAVCYVV